MAKKKKQKAWRGYPLRIRDGKNLKASEKLEELEVLAVQENTSVNDLINKAIENLISAFRLTE